MVVWAVATEEKGYPLLTCELIPPPVDVLGVLAEGSHAGSEGPSVHPSR